MYEYLPVLIVVTAPLLLLLVFWIPLWRMRSHEGESIPDLHGLWPDTPDTHDQVVFYFSAPACAPCKVVKPLIDQLAASGQRVIAVDVSRSRAIARKFHIRVTPAVIVVEKNRIKRTLVGPRLVEEINALLGKTPVG